jgi:hypothetical protein
MTNASAPGWVEPSLDETDMLLWFLQYERDKVLRSVENLTDEQSRWTPDGRLLPIIGVINHLTEVEWRWINGRFRQEPTSESGGRVGSTPPGDPEFDVDPSRSLAEVVDAYRARAKETDEIVRSAPSLDAPCPGAENQTPRPGLYLRWCVVHLIEETAHHAGHVDATRELLDGTTF